MSISCIELVAAEPLVIDPVAFAFDEDRIMYVVETVDIQILPKGENLHILAE
ncbi:MAG: hypothetical protein WD426_15600 [Anditalea sp.]